MFQTLCQMKVTKGDSEYTFNFPPGRPGGEVFDVLCEFRAMILQKIHESIAAESQNQSSGHEPEVK